MKNAVEWKIVKFKFVEITSLTHRGSLIYFVNLSLSEFHLLVEANISARLEKQFLLQWNYTEKVSNQGKQKLDSFKTIIHVLKYIT